MSTIPDKAVLQKLNQRLSRLGGAQQKLTTSIRGGEVTLSGTIQYDMQRASIVKVANSVPGVRRVIDQLRVKPKEKYMGRSDAAKYTAKRSSNARPDDQPPPEPLAVPAGPAPSPPA